MLRPLRKSCGVRLRASGTTRTTVRKFAHDCIPTGPPVSSQPHALKGEAAQWVDDRLEEEVQRGQLVRGPSAWGSAPFPTKEMPNHKRARKRRLVVDFVDAVSGFNQIRNTKRAREVLAIVARSGKYLPVGLTFGPVNGPDDFNFVVDRAYAPGKGRRLRYTKEWIAYVDDLTVRTGRVVDGKFYTDSAADQAVREACAKGSSQAAPQSPESAMEALGFKPKPPPHDAARSDTTFRGPESGGFQGCGFKGFGAGVVRGLFAALWKGARGVPRRWCATRGGLPRCSARTRGGSNSLCRPYCLRSVVRSSRRQCECRSAAFCVGVEGRRSGGARVPCVPPRTLEASQKGGQKGGDGHRAPRPGSRGGGSSRREPTPKVAAVRRPGADRTGAPAIGIAAAVLRAVTRRLAVADSRRTAEGDHAVE